MNGHGYATHPSHRRTPTGQDAQPQGSDTAGFADLMAEVMATAEHSPTASTPS
jgi:hypothetical protein